MRVVPALVFAGLSCSIACSSSIAMAAEPSTVDYSAPSSCPDRDALLTELHARTDAFVESANAPRKFIVRIAAQLDDRVRGSLAIERSGRVGTPRSLEAKTCLEAIRAISFMVALVLDPDAKAPPPTPPPDSTSEDTATTTHSDGGGVPADASPHEDPAPASPPPPARGVGPPDRDEPLPKDDDGERRARAPRWSASLFVDAVGLGAPGAVVGGGVGVAARPVYWLELRTSLHQTLASTVTAMGTSSTFAWTVGRIESCVDAFHAGRFEVGPCVNFDLGRLAAEGGGVRRPESPSRLWLAGGLDARAQMTLFDPLMFELSAGLFAPFDRTEFAYRPTFVVYRPPAVGVQASLAVGARWR